MMNSIIDMLTRQNNRKRAIQIEQISQIINQQTMKQQQIWISQQDIGGVIGKLNEEQKGKEGKQGKDKVETEEQ